MKLLGDVATPNRVEAGYCIGKCVLIAALGNPLRGDDGVGSEIIHTLDNEFYLSENVTCCETNGNGLLSILIDSRFDKVLIVDTANFNGTPGEWIRVELDDLKLASLDLDSCISLHSLNLPEVMTIMETLGVEIPEITIYGIQPHDLSYSDELSDAVKATVQPLSRVIRDEVSLLIEA
jgi:hydrogenase maturation protease